MVLRRKEVVVGSQGGGRREGWLVQGGSGGWFSGWRREEVEDGSQGGGGRKWRMILRVEEGGMAPSPPAPGPDR